MPASTRAKSRRRAKRVPARALQAAADHRRTLNISVDSPFLDLGTAYLELPRRIMACRTPFQIWLEYIHFGQRLFSAVSAMFALPSRQLPR
jgi:hypothetical protein